MVANEQKPLTERQARRCEDAQEPVCRCRCGGRLHGSRRGAGGGSPTPTAFFEALPEDDPHYVASAAKREAVALARRQAKRQEAIEHNRRKWEILSRPPVTWEDLVR